MRIVCTGCAFQYVKNIHYPLGHPQPPTPIQVKNTMAIGIVNSTVKQQRSQVMEMRQFWLLNQSVQKYIKFYYQPGLENINDYPTKHHTSRIHKHVRPYYLHMAHLPIKLQQVVKPSPSRRCGASCGFLL